jgi:2-iminobutanoate/2-iminopropanoate deaminase
MNTIFLKNIEDFALVNEVYATYFNKPYPARSCVAVKALPKDVVLEMEAIALK